MAEGGFDDIEMRNRNMEEEEEEESEGETSFGGDDQSPIITEVKISVEGVPNSVYSQGMPKRKFFEEAFRIFHGGYENSDAVMSIEKFYKDSFALCVDLRTLDDNFVYGNGKKLVNTQSGLLLEITKTAISANVMCHIFVISDGSLNIVNKDLSSIQF